MSSHSGNTTGNALNLSLKMCRDRRVEQNDVQIWEDLAAAIAFHDARQVCHGVTAARISILDDVRPWKLPDLERRSRKRC